MKPAFRTKAVLSLTVFSMFFGAGNLIFPPYLAAQSGENFPLALIGFYATAIGLPITALLSVERTDGLDNLAKRVHPLFGIIYTTAIYLAIGPCLAIPRTASTSYEMLQSSFALSGNIPRLLYSLMFFLISAAVALNPEKLSRTLGRITCPLLIALIAVLTIGAIMTGSGDFSYAASNGYDTSPFSRGFMEGYQTMDAIAGLVFGMIAVMNIKALGIEERSQLQKTEAEAGLAAGAIFIIVYTAIASVGRFAASHGIPASNGADILSAASLLIFGKAGSVILSLIFIAACFNTCTGLISSCSVYFEKLCPAIPRKAWVFIFAAVSFIISNIGLDGIISISAPVLTLLYPVAIVLIILAFIPDGEKYRYVHRIASAAALFFSALPLIFPESTMASYPLLWMIPTIISALIGYAIDRKKLREH